MNLRYWLFYREADILRLTFKIKAAENDESTTDRQADEESCQENSGQGVDLGSVK